MAKVPAEDAFEEGRPDPRPRSRESDEGIRRPREEDADGTRRRSEENDRPRRRREEYDDDDDRPRRRPRRQESDGLDTLIPYKNGQALAAYYVGVFSLIPCLGLVLGPLALIFGILGLRFANRHPEAKGGGHAITGIVLGSLMLLVHLAAIAIIAFGIMRSSRR